MSWFYSLCFHLKEKANIFITSPAQVWNQSWSISGEFQLPDVHSCLRRCEDSRRHSRRESLFSVQFGRFVCNLWLQLAAVTCRRCVSGGCLSAVMRRSGAACNFAALCGNVASDRGMPRTKRPVSVRLKERGWPPLPPVGRPGRGDSHPELQGSSRLSGNNTDSLKSFDSEFSCIDEFIDQLEDR